MTPVLASARAAWQGREMPDPRPTRPQSPLPARNTRAGGGAFIAIGAMLGAGVGFAIGQATPGFLIGLGLGIAAAVYVWKRDRPR